MEDGLSFERQKRLYFVRAIYTYICSFKYRNFHASEWVTEEVADVCLAKFIFNLAIMLFTSWTIALCGVFLCCYSTVLFLPRLNVVSGVAEKVLCTYTINYQKSVNFCAQAWHKGSQAFTGLFLHTPFRQLHTEKGEITLKHKLNLRTL